MDPLPQLPLSDAERDVLKLLWEQGPATVRAMQARLAGAGQAWTRSTVITLLQRLERKGYVDSDRSGFAFVFRPRVSREQVMHARLMEVADELSDGDPLPLVAAFAQRHAFTAEELRRFHELIETYTPRHRSRGAP